MMKTIEISAWLVASVCFTFANVVTAYNHFFGGK